MARLVAAGLSVAGTLCALSACPSPPDPCGLAAVFEVLPDNGILSLDVCTGQLALGDSADPGRWLRPAPEGTPALAWADDDLTSTMTQGRYGFVGTFGERLDVDEDGGLRTTAGSWQGTVGGRPASLTFGPGPGPSVHVGLEVAGAPDRVSVAFGCQDGERFFGLGARPDGVDHTGKTRMFLTAEQGIGQREYGLEEIDPLRGRTGDSYFPVPFTVTDRGLGVGLGGHAVSTMYLCGADEPGVFRVEAWDDRIDVFLFPAQDARDAVGRWTRAPGPPAPAPDWAYGPWLASQRGTDNLLAMAERVRELGIPATAIWSQDWIGGSENAFGYDLDYHWQWDEAAYPALPAAIDDLHELGFAFLGYFNPFVTEGFVEWEEALDRGFLIDRPDGEPYTFSIVTRFGSVVDLLDPEAWEWAKEFMAEAPAMGQDGWMCDFAEWMPFDAQLAGGVLGAEHHNEYPLLWQRLNMEVLNEGLGAGNGLCFNRSGWTGSWTITPVTWGGDQETTFARDDGLPTARHIGVGLGLSGVGRYGSDIAGFSSLFGGVSTRELYLRWVAMGAFEPVMRLHDGLRDEANWRWDQDAETTEIFARYARLHLRLLPLWRILNRDYEVDGVPFMRHGILVEPRASAAFELLRDAPDQHFLGDDLLVAPVVEPGVVERDVAFPAGRWFALQGDAVLDVAEGGEVRVIPAPLGDIPVFARAGSILPLLSEQVVTSYRTAQAGVLDDGDAAEVVDLLVFSGLAATVSLVDGPTFALAAVDPEAVELSGLTLDGVTLPPCAAERDLDCVRSVDLVAGRLRVEVGWGDGPRTLAGTGWTLSTPDGGGKRGVVELRVKP